MHDERIARANLKQEWNLSSPDGEIAGIMDAELTGNGSNMMNETEVFESETLRVGSWIDIQIREGEVPGLLPTLDICFDFRGP
jgi:hypothetical protein